MSVTASPVPVVLPGFSFAPSTIGTRLVSLDVFRGLTVAAMILVTDPGTYAARYRELGHSEWMGATATDMIMPCFLFIVGVSITLAFARRMERGATRGKLALQALRRSALLIALGLAINGFPAYHWHNLPLPGILQRIGCSYLIGSLLYLALGRRETGRERAEFRRDALVFAGVIAAILAAYWWALMHVPVPGYGVGRLDYFGCLPGYVDRTVLGVNHMWIWGTRPTSYDPDGLLTLLPGACQTLFGLIAGSWMRTGVRPWRKVAGLAITGALLVCLGLALSHWMPLNKKIWTSTFSLFGGGVAFLSFAFFYAVVDLLRSRRWTPPALVFGTNAILAFVISSVITLELDRIHIHEATGGFPKLHGWLYGHLFATWLAPIHGSLAYAVAITVINGLILLPLYRRRIFLRV